MHLLHPLGHAQLQQAFVQITAGMQRHCLLRWGDKRLRCRLQHIHHKRLQRHLIMAGALVGLLHQRGIPLQRCYRLLLALLQPEAQMGFSRTPFQYRQIGHRQRADKTVHLLPLAARNAGKKRGAGGAMSRCGSTGTAHSCARRFATGRSGLMKSVRAALSVPRFSICSGDRVSNRCTSAGC